MPVSWADSRPGTSPDVLLQAGQLGCWSVRTPMIMPATPASARSTVGWLPGGAAGSRGLFHSAGWWAQRPKQHSTPVCRAAAARSTAVAGAAAAGRCGPAAAATSLGRHRCYPRHASHAGGGSCAWGSRGIASSRRATHGGTGSVWSRARPCAVAAGLPAAEPVISGQLLVVFLSKLSRCKEHGSHVTEQLATTCNEQPTVAC